MDIKVFSAGLENGEFKIISPSVVLQSIGDAITQVVSGEVTFGKLKMTVIGLGFMFEDDEPVLYVRIEFGIKPKAEEDLDKTSYAVGSYFSSISYKCELCSRTSEEIANGLAVYRVQLKSFSTKSKLRQSPKWE